MDILQMKYYLTVVQEGSISRAAKALNMTQPPVSMQIRLLEEELGCTLFIRGSRNITLTEEGKIFYEHAGRILNMTKSAAVAVADCHNAATGTLRVGVVSSLVDWSAENWFKGFVALHPQVNYELAEGSTYELLEQLSNRILDVALARTPFSARGFACFSLEPEEMLLIGRKEFVGALPPKVSLKQVATMPLLIYRRWRQVLDKAFAAKGYKPRILCLSDDARTCVTWAQAGIGTAIVPADIFAQNTAVVLQSRVIHGLAPQAATTLVTNEDGCDTAVGRAFVNYFQKCCANQIENVKV